MAGCRRFVRSGCRTRAAAWSSRSAADSRSHSACRRHAALLNDANPHLINFYRWLQRGLIADLPMHNDRALYARYRTRFNDLLRAGAARHGGSRVALLLPESHRLQRSLPFQQERRVQRAVRPVHADRLRARLHAVHRDLRALGFHEQGFRGAAARRAAISSTRIRPTTCRSRRTRRADFPGTTRCGWHSG